MAGGRRGRSRGPTSAAGRSFTSRGRRSIRTACTPPSTRAGSGRSCSARATVAGVGLRWGTSSSTRARRASTCGTTARHTHGNSSASGTWSHPSSMPRPCTPAASLAEIAVVLRNRFLEGYLSLHIRLGDAEVIRGEHARGSAVDRRRRFGPRRWRVRCIVSGVIGRACGVIGVGRHD
jgi:hypothetical protein